MYKTLIYGLRVFKLSWKANGIYAVLQIFSKIYESTFYPFLQIFLLSKLLDLLGSDLTNVRNNVLGIATTYVIFTLLKVLLTTFLDIKNEYLNTSFECYLDRLINEKLAQLDPATFEQSSFQELLSQIERVKGILLAHLMRFTGLIDQVFKFITATIVIGAIFPLFVPIIFVAAIPTYLAWDIFRKKTWSYYVEKRSNMFRVVGYIKSLLTEASTSKEVAIFNSSSQLLKKIFQKQQHYLTKFKKANDPWIIVIGISRGIQYVVFFATQYFNLIRTLSGVIGVGQFTLVFHQALNLTTSSEEILNQYSSIVTRNKYLDVFFNFLQTKKFIINPEKPVDLPKDIVPAIIKFENVSFKYPGTKQFVLKDLNLTIQSGQKIALVGENGSGKTTIVKLLLRFYDVTSGKITINGVDIRELDLIDWHNQVGALFQNFIRYEFLVRENIELGDVANIGDQEKLKIALQKSGADEVVSKLPKGLKQQLGKQFDNGVELSGGQWQRIALARAFYRDVPILILDEPTSAIDAKAEYEIFDRVQKLQSNKTVIIISHRFSTVRHADRIFVLSSGKIIEQGEHAELIKLDGVYAELFELQAQGYR